MEPVFTPGLPEDPRETLPVAGSFCAFLDGDLVLVGEPSRLPTDLQVVSSATVRGLYLGSLDGTPLWAVELRGDTSLPKGWRSVSLRAATAMVPASVWRAASYASQLLHWDRTASFCGACGSRTEPVGGERARRCPACDHRWYPRVSPCTITLVHDGDRVLMTRKAEWPAGRYGLVAGFLEPAETLEECARREVLEETGVTVEAPVYQGSQPWPFPHQLMVGFRARYASGEVAHEESELEDARWFPVDALPVLPPRFSIARRLIDDWVDEVRPPKPR
ncbi:MAG: NAD(+) diphosphatase [Deltaproteobacteria bacterium]|nr:NAD(+) diphosphatase [Deltaproteobacteria bacterium]